MPRNDHDRVIALAGLFQATHLVRSIARTGQADTADLETCLNSVFKIDANDSTEIYDGIAKLRTGLQLLTSQLTQPQDMEITRYVLGLLVLERKLSRKPSLLDAIRSAIDTTFDKLQYFALTDDNIIASLADIYVRTVSTLTPKIMVSGEPSYLTQQSNADRIRALLLSGIRAAVLWRQSGGGRLTLLLRRKALFQEAERMLNTLEQPMVSSDAGH